MSKIKSALICGVSGQDGGYLARFLLSKGYRVIGTSRYAHGTSFANLTVLRIVDQVELVSMDPGNFENVLSVISKYLPDEVYFLAGQSSVGLSFELPAETIQSVVLGVLNILEVCRIIDKKFRLYHAGSSECFGDTRDFPANELTSFSPRSPYAVAKSSAFWLVDNYRDAYGIFACTGLLFNHESPLRPVRFVTQKIVQTAKRIANGSDEILYLGRLDISRDWGWAPEYVEAMWLMLQQEQPEDFVIATGITYRLEDFVSVVFDNLGFDWRKHVIQIDSFFRPTDILISRADPSKAKRKLNWQANLGMSEVVCKMINCS